MTVKSIRLSCTSTPQVGEAIESLLWSGFWGNSRSTVVERLICHALRDVVSHQELDLIATQIEIESAAGSNESLMPQPSAHDDL